MSNIASDGVVTTNLIARWKKGLVGDKDQPWYLITSSDAQTPRASLATLQATSYSRRFDIEELFRDAKNEHLGWSLSKTRIKRGRPAQTV